MQAARMPAGATSPPSSFAPAIRNSSPSVAGCAHGASHTAPEFPPSCTRSLRAHWSSQTPESLPQFAPCASARAHTYGVHAESRTPCALGRAHVLLEPPRLLARSPRAGRILQPDVRIRQPQVRHPQMRIRSQRLPERPSRFHPHVGVKVCEPLVIKSLGL